MPNQSTNQISRIAQKYFSLLANAFPVMCASDEFHFLPRVQEAVQFLDRMDELSQEAIGTAGASVRDLQNQLRKQPAAQDFEEEIDRQFLLHNMAGVLIELEEVQSWRHNPLMYLKVGCIGVDHAVNKPAADEKERFERTIERLAALNGLLRQAGKNLSTIPGPYYRAAVAMVEDAQEYLEELLREVRRESHRRHLIQACSEAQHALAAFIQRLRAIGPTPAGSVQSISVEELVQRHFGCTRPLEEIFAIAEEEWQDSQEEMDRLRRSIDPSQDWQQLYENYLPGTGEELDLFRLYGDEIESLCNLCQKLKLLDGHLDQEVVLSETPTYLRSVRSGASYSAPLTIDPGEQAYFYITAGNTAGNSHMDVLRRQRLHREFRFLSAHETYPGHHLLDSIRRNLENPVRCQIESPLFYEGWAYYAEAILAESGYVKDELELLVDCKRRLWRAARCLIDSGLAMQSFTMEKGVDLLVSVGFAADEAMAQVERFRLNPGYQLCYSLGKYEIMELRQRFLPAFGWQHFHRLLLEGGEIPFHLAAWRFENLTEDGSSGMGTLNRRMSNKE
jgi:cell division septum initiation protein DivIVA